MKKRLAAMVISAAMIVSSLSGCGCAASGSRYPVCSLTTQTIGTVNAGDAEGFNNVLLHAISQIDDKGGYYTGRKHPDGFIRNTWEGMDSAFVMGDQDQHPVIDMSVARPSFCSSATYMLLIKSLSEWDNEKGNKYISRDAWINLKPYTMTQKDASGNVIAKPEDDGYGCWGRANANGPGMAVLVKELGAGTNYYIGSKAEYTSDAYYLKAWDKAKRGDFMKIFWNDGIGCDDNNSDGDERGHMVVYLGSEKATAADGSRDDVIYYWSSNGSHTDINAGYSISKCRQSDIVRAVLTEITAPEKFDNAKNIAPDNANQWLSDLNGKKHGTLDELKVNTLNTDKGTGLKIGLRDAGATDALVNASVNTASFNAYVYYVSNRDLQINIGPDAEALYKHWITSGAAEGRKAI